MTYQFKAKEQRLNTAFMDSAYAYGEISRDTDANGITLVVETAAQSPEKPYRITASKDSVSVRDWFFLADHSRETISSSALQKMNVFIDAYVDTAAQDLKRYLKECLAKGVSPQAFNSPSSNP